MSTLPTSLTRPKRDMSKTLANIADSLAKEDEPSEPAAKKPRAEKAPFTPSVGAEDRASTAAKGKKLAAASVVTPSLAAEKPTGKPAPKGNKSLLAAAPASDVANIKTKDVKKRLTAHVKACASMVDADWHDGYEEQGEECMEWMRSCGDVIESGLRVSVVHGCGHDLAHEAMKLVADTWAQVEKIPFRCDPGECIADGYRTPKIEIAGLGEYQCSGADALLRLAWPLLLGAAAASDDVCDETLLRFIKDAVDNGVTSPHQPSEEEGELGEGAPVSVAAGRSRLESLVVGRKAEWSCLPSTKKAHKQRRCIDRRFDGPKHLRTRDFGNSDEDDGDCVIC